MAGLEDLPNIGKVLASELETAGIGTPEDLRQIGSVEALVRINGSVFQEGCLNKLYALEGAIQGIRWHGLATQEKEILKNQYQQAISK